MSEPRSKQEALVQAFGVYLASGDPEDTVGESDEVVIGIFAPQLVSSLSVRGLTVAEVEHLIATALDPHERWLAGARKRSAAHQAGRRKARERRAGEAKP